MTTELLFDFTVDKAAKMVYITREFDAELSLVWDAFTKKELLDQWLAPKPLIAKTKYQDFKVGGKRFYAMISPEGQERWDREDHRSRGRGFRQTGRAHLPLAQGTARFGQALDHRACRNHDR